MSRSGRAAGAWGQLLLIVVLALGVFVMHTTGHPDSPSAHQTAHPSAHAPAAMAASGPDRGDRAAPHAPGMDMASLCLAVLGAAVLLVLVRAALRRCTEGPANRRAGAVTCLVPRPPPRAPDLTLLSILRI
ncbi:DUF6153 family protein [Streptomyces sp. NPDC054838]